MYEDCRQCLHILHKCGLTIEVYASDFTAELQPNKECRNKFNTRVALEANLRHWVLHFK